MIVGDSVMITNVRPMWSCGEIRQLLATSGSEVKVLKKRLRTAVVFKDDIEIKDEVMKMVKGTVAIDEGIGNGEANDTVKIPKEGAVANRMDAGASTGTSGGDDIPGYTNHAHGMAPVGSTTSAKGLTPPDVIEVPDKKVADKAACTGVSTCDQNTSLSAILCVSDDIGLGGSLKDSIIVNSSAILLPQGDTQPDSFPCTPFCYYDSYSPLKTPIEIKDRYNHGNVTADREIIDVEATVKDDARVADLEDERRGYVEVVGETLELNEEGAKVTGSGMQPLHFTEIADVDRAAMHKVQSETSSFKKSEKSESCAYGPEQALNLRACINSLSDAAPVPFISLSKASSTFFSPNDPKKHPECDLPKELHNKEEVSLRCTIISWKDIVSGLNGSIIDKLGEAENVKGAESSCRVSSRRGSKTLGPKDRILSSTKRNAANTIDISSISSLEIHCLNERSGMGVLLDYRVHTVLLSSLQNTWMVPGNKIQITFGLLSQIDVVNDLVRLSRSDHTGILSLGDVCAGCGNFVGDKGDERERERGYWQLYKGTLCGCGSPSVQVSTTSHGDRKKENDGRLSRALEGERRRYEALCSNKVYFDTPFNASFAECCARHRVNSVAVFINSAISEADTNKAPQIPEPNYGSDAQLVAGDIQHQNFSGIVDDHLDIVEREKEDKGENQQGHSISNKRCKNEKESDEVRMKQKKQKSPYESKKKKVETCPPEALIDIVGDTNTHHTQPPKIVLISVEKCRSIVVMEVEFQLLPIQLQALFNFSRIVETSKDEREISGEESARPSSSFDLVYAEIWHLDPPIPDSLHPRGKPLVNPHSCKYASSVRKESSDLSSRDAGGTKDVMEVLTGMKMASRPRWKVVWIEERYTNTV